MNLEYQLAEQQPVTWLVGEVAEVSADTVVLLWRGERIDGVAYIDAYTPVVGDKVHCLSWQPVGILILGSGDGNGTPNPALPTPVVLEVAADSSGTWNTVTEAWTSNTRVQSPEDAGCWFYDSSLWSAMVLSILGVFEIQVTQTVGDGPPEFFVHNNTGLSVAPELMSETIYVAPPLTIGVSTWVPLPIGWGQMLLSGEAKGIGVGLGEYDATYSGTGRLRFTTI